MTKEQRNNIKRRPLALILIIALCIGILPINQTPASKAASRAGYGLSNPSTSSDGVTTWDCVWFGNYPQSDATGATKEPIKWRVLSVNGDDAFLLADQNLDCQKYNDTWVDVTWETCTMRSWLNGYGAGANVCETDYSADNFLDNAFNASEQAAIRNTAVSNEDNPYYGTEGGNNTIDKVYLLSINEVLNPSYGFHSDPDEYAESRRAKNTAYAKEQGVWTNTSGEYAGNGDWWLRSPGYYSSRASFVYINGYVFKYCSDVIDVIVAARPALHLNLSSTSSWSYAGTVTSKGGENVTGTPVPVQTATPAGDSAPDLSLFDDASGTIKSDGISKYLISDWNFKSPTFPVKIKKDYKEDGSYTIKATIGIGKKDVLDQESSWSQYKKQVEKFKKNTGKTSELTRLIQAYDGKAGTFSVTDKIKAKPTLGFMGYYELEYDKNDKLISQEGGGAATASWSGKKTWQSVVMAGPIPIPLYFDLTGGLDLEAALGIKFSSPTQSSWTGSLKLKPSLSLGGGLGVSGVATVGVEGNGGFTFQAIPWSKMDYAASISLKAYIAFILDWSWQLPGAELSGNVWDTTSGTRRKGTLNSYGSFTSDSLSLTNRSYAKKTTEWNGRTESAQSRKGQGLRSLAKNSGYSSMDISVLQEYIMPNTIPQIERVAGKTVMVFQSNAADRKTADSSCLMYSVLEGGSWSEPKAVYDNGTCDLYSSMRVVNDTLYLVWQKEKSGITDSEDAAEILDDMEEKSEICFARFDPQENSFEDISYVTNDSVVDMMPVIVENTEDVQIVWIRNTDNDFFNASGANCVITSKLENGIWTAPEQVTVIDEYTGELAAAMADGKLAVSYVTTDMDSTGEYEVQTTVRLAVDGVVSTVSEEEASAQSIHFHKGQLYYLQDSFLHKVDVTDGSDELILMESDQNQEDSETEQESGNGCVGSAYRIYETAGKTAVIWTEATEEGCRILSSVKGEDGFSQPVTLYESGKSIQNFDAVLLEDGNWQFVCNEKDLVDGDERVSLLFVQKESLPKLSLEYITAEESQIEEGLMPLQIAVANKGETEITSYTLQIQLADGNVVEKTIPCSLRPGESAVLTESIDVSDISDTSLLIVSILAQGQKETEGTSQTAQVGNTDVSLRLAKQTSDDLEKVTLTAIVTNESSIGTKAEVKWYEKDTDKLLKTESVGEVPAGGSRQIDMELSAEDVLLGSADAKYYYAAVTAEKTDYNETNNTDYAAVYPEEIKRVFPQGSATPDSPVASPVQDQHPAVADATSSGTGTSSQTASSGSSKTSGSYKAPAKVTALKLKAKKKALQVSWKKVSGASGYQIWYSTSKKFKKKSAKTVKKPKLTIKKLKSGKTYFVKVRAYTLKNGKKVYGAWSKTMKKKVKK